MIAATRPVQRPPHAKLLVVDTQGRIHHAPRSALLGFLRPGDLVIANDASTLPASLQGMHARTGLTVEIRLAGRQSLLPQDFGRFTVVVFGAGDFRTRTEQRPLPPPLAPGDHFSFSSMTAEIERLLDHPRLALLRFDGDPDQVWAGLARHGKPIQYAHVPTPLKLWDVWTPIAGVPAAFESPSAGFALDWQLLKAMQINDIEFATITHAAGISSTGDEQLDRRLPFDEPYRISAATAEAIARTRNRGSRIVAVGTTVVRALEHAASLHGEVRAGDGIATQRIGAATRLRVVDAVLSGTHEVDTSHYQLLRAFTDDTTLRKANAELEAHAYLTHEFGDSVLIERGLSRHGNSRSGKQVLSCMHPTTDELLEAC